MVDSAAVGEQSGPDLRQAPPSSVHAKFHGLVMLARITDKARAAAFGHLGEYTFNCPLDRGVFDFLGIAGADYLEAVKAGTVDAFVEVVLRRKSPEEISTWNDRFIHYVPAPESDSWRRLVAMRERYAPGRDDIVNWADVLDLEEGREVPLRSAPGSAG